MDRLTDAEGYNIIRPFFKRAYKKEGNSVNTGDTVMVLALCNSSHDPLSVYQVSFNSFVYFQICSGRAFIAKN